eukprot:m.61269 g.61269  ORF g.61269 m.61269 type:complete len:127 (-) comp7988_c0_seq3:12-392(-)
MFASLSPSTSTAVLDTSPSFSNKSFSILLCNTTSSISRFTEAEPSALKKEKQKLVHLLRLFLPPPPPPPPAFFLYFLQQGSMLDVNQFDFARSTVSSQRSNVNSSPPSQSNTTQSNTTNYNNITTT